MRKSSTELNSKIAWGYQEWRFQAFCGATVSCDWAATRVEVRWTVAAEAETVLWQMSLRVLEQLTHQHSPLKPWLRFAQGLEKANLGSPLHMGWQALQAASGCPGYPSELSQKQVKQTDIEPDPSGASHSRYLTLLIASPYRDFVQHAIQLTGQWLNWSHAALQHRELELKREELQRWCAGFDKLASLLPAPSLMAMHHRFWQQGISWVWLGEDRTRIGEGARQKVVSGAVHGLPLDDPDAWRVPIYTVTGSVGKTTTARLLWQLLQCSRQTIALAASDGAWIGPQRVIEGDCIGGITARALLQSRAVEAAVFEQGRGGIVKQGVPYVRSDVAILLNVQHVHLGLDGIETLEQMARTKAVGLRPARLWVLNRDDEQCRRLAGQHPAHATVWFSASMSSEDLQNLSLQALAASGIERDVAGEPRSITVWQSGRAIERWPLDGVTPYQGLLGNKTIEELLAAVSAAFFGPLVLSEASWPARLRALRLDADNHAFRTSVHRQGAAVFVLDKAAELASLRWLQEAVESLALREGCDHRIVAFCRSASEVPERHLESAQSLHGFMDEFVCFDRPDTYTSDVALPIYTPGSIPSLLRDELLRLNARSGLKKPVTVVDEWALAEAYVRQRLDELPGKTLVLINQPSTASSKLNQQILAFATTGLNVSNARA